MKIYKGHNAKIYFEKEELGFADSVTLEISSGLEAYYTIEKRSPHTLIPGPEEVTGTISRVWINLDLLDKVIGAEKLPRFEIVFIAENIEGAPYVVCENCVFETGIVSVPQDGFLREDYDFMAVSVIIGLGPYTAGPPEFSSLLIEDWNFGPPSVIPLLLDEGWNYPEPPSFDLLISEEWSS